MLLRFFILAISLVPFLTEQVEAQTQETPAPKVGYIRFWDMLPASSGSFQLRKAGKDSELLASSVAYRYSSYVEVPVGQYQLSIVKTGNASPMTTLSADVKPDSYFTVIMAPQGTGFKLEYLNDTIDPKNISQTLTIHNYFPGSSISVTAGNQPLASALAYGGSYAATGLNGQKTSVRVQAKLPNGTPAQSDIDLDFKGSPHLTLLVIPDSYGRFRPRVIADGRNL